MTSPVYLDNNSTTMMDPLVVQTMAECMASGLVNPASQHQLGRKALSALELAKQELLDLVDAPNTGMASAQVILTSGGTEANNLAIGGISGKRPGLIIVGATEHPSCLDAANQFGASDRVRILPVDSYGGIKTDVLEEWLDAVYQGRDPTASQVSLVSVMLGNNETGVVCAIREICNICNKYEVPVHSDCVQAIGRIPFSMCESGLSAMTLTAHKIHGPVGIGALILKHDVSLDPILFGGGQQLGLRPGTEPVVLAIALADCLKHTLKALNDGTYDRVRMLRNVFEDLVKRDIQFAAVVADTANRLPHTSTISFPRLDRQALLMALDLSGLACSTGSACSSGSGRPSHVLQAMNLPHEEINGALRFSLSRFTTEDEVRRAFEILLRVTNSLDAK